MDLAAQEVLGICETLNDDRWQLPRSAVGWSICATGNSRFTCNPGASAKSWLGERREIRVSCATRALERRPMADQTTSEIATYFRVCDGARVRYADTKADSDTVILKLAPWPETLWAYRRVWSQISAVGRVVALDMPGFGHSDQPERLIAPDTMGDFLALLIDEWDLGAPHIVGPDVGTAAALFLANKAPEKITSLSIGGGAVSSPVAAGGALEAVVGAPSLDDVRQLDARVNISAAVESAAPQATEPQVHED
jgi:alpha/beta hydrolase family protein